MIFNVDQLAPKDCAVFLRSDLNVPLDGDSRIVDDTRITAALPTLKYLLENENRVVLGSHLGRPKGRVDRQFSLLPIAERLTELMACEVIFPENCIGEGVRRLAREMRPGVILLLENLRFHPGETANDPTFAKQLASLADVYIDDAFGVIHRAHASIAGMVEHFENKGMGFLVKKELAVLAELTNEPKRPFWAILGGAKVPDKIGLIEHLLDRVDGLILGGGLAYTFLKAQGHDIGNSLCDESKLYIANRILKKAMKKGVKVILPLDHRIGERVALETKGTVVGSARIPAGQMGLDIGPETINACEDALADAGTIFWNGPLGYYENPEFSAGTTQVAHAVAKSSATSIIGGGDSLAAVRSLGLENEITHISTGGGASLAYLEGEELPGLKALETKEL